MNEDYVSFEVAKLLKEKGFDWFCENHYIVNCEPDGKALAFAGFIYYKKPTIYIARKWLRETKGIYIWVEPVIGHRWTVSFCDLNVCAEESDWIERELHKDGYPIYYSYEDALNAGILETLKLI